MTIERREYEYMYTTDIYTVRIQDIEKWVAISFLPCSPGIPYDARNAMLSAT